MRALDFKDERIQPDVTEDDLAALQPRLDELHRQLEEGRGPGSDFLGWLHLPSQMTGADLQEIENAARRIRNTCEAFVNIGIGGSYLGARAAVSFLGHAFANQLKPSQRPGPEIYFAGHNLSSDYHADLFDLLADKRIGLNVISKSGTTTEPAIAFRLLQQMMERKFGPREAKQRIVVTTDRKKGALKSLADQEGYPTFVIPDDVGGRYSVLTPVGLLPIAVAGIDIAELMEGARFLEAVTRRSSRLEDNPAYRYAALRHLLYRKGKKVEILAAFHPSLDYLLEWWKQLAGESEGKDQSGIFPASVEYTTDLHSLGQWVQEGERIIFETFLRLDHSSRALEIPEFSNDRDGLNYLAGKTLDFVNAKAYEGTARAHRDGGVPNMTLTLPERTPAALGQLFYFFERAVAISGYLQEVNPFDQPGVEFYKKNMFSLLNKPGYEKG